MNTQKCGLTVTLSIPQGTDQCDVRVQIYATRAGDPVQTTSGGSIDVSPPDGKTLLN